MEVLVPFVVITQGLLVFLRNNKLVGEDIIYTMITIRGWLLNNTISLIRAGLEKYFITIEIVLSFSHYLLLN